MSTSANESALTPPGKPAWAMRPAFRIWLLAVALGLATIALYWPAFNLGFVNYDDDDYVTANVHVQKGLTLHNIVWASGSIVGGNWHPLTMLSHMLDCQLYGLHPWGHHLTSVLLHALDTVLLFLLLCRLTGAIQPSAWVAVFFAAHPLHVESVAWVAERKDVLSTCLGLLTLLCYVRYAQGQGTRPGDPTGLPCQSRPFYRSPFYWLALPCFALGLMSKPMLVTWPFVLLLLDYWPLNRFKASALPALLLEKIPFLALAFAAGAITFAVQKQTGAVRTFQYLPLAMRCENAIISYCRYLFKIFWPAHLAAFYPLPFSWPPGWVLLAGLFLAAVSVGFWFKRRSHPYLLMGWLWFLGTLVPVIGLVQVGAQAMADRYTYIPSIGVLVIVVWALYEFSHRGPRQAVLLTLAGFAALAFCCAATRRQIGYWQNGETLFRHALQAGGDNDIARNDLGLALLGNGQTNAAMSQFKAAIALNPASVAAYENLGIVLAREGRTNAAIGQFQAALRWNPQYAKVHYRLGNLLAQNGQIDEAIAQLQQAVACQPNFAQAHNNLGSLLSKKGRTDEAIAQFQEALRIEPDYVDAHYNLGNALARAGRLDESISHFQAVVRLAPDFASGHYYLGVALEKKGMADEAIRQFQEAVRLRPGDASAYNTLGAVLGEQGRLDEAIRQFQTAVRLKPDYAEANTNLALALALKAGKKPSPAAP